MDLRFRYSDLNQLLLSLYLDKVLFFFLFIFGDHMLIGEIIWKPSIAIHLCAEVWF